jgi:hypothetical protein
MTGTPSTTTPPQADFTQPERLIDEDTLAIQLSKPINAETFTHLITSNFLMVMNAYDHRCERPYFQDIVVNAFNFQNRLVRIAELNGLREQMEMPDLDVQLTIKDEVDRHMVSAMEYKATMQKALRLMQEMRRPGEPVS